MRDQAKDKADELIAQAKHEADEVFSSDETDGMYISDEEMFEKIDKKQINSERKMKLMVKLTVLTMELIIRMI